MAENSSLTPRQTKAIAALLMDGTIAEAAKTAGIAETTIYRYLRDDTFKIEFRQAQNAVIATALSRLAGAARLAAGVLVEIIENRDVNPAVRVQACNALLSQLQRLNEQYSLLERVEKLEEQLS